MKLRNIYIYSVAYNRPDFIKLQYDSVNQFLVPANGGYKTSFKLFINSKDKFIREQLKKECIKLGIEYLVVPIKENELYNGGLTAYNYIRDLFFPCAEKNDLSIIMDSDMFFYNGLNIDNLMDGCDTGAIYHQREKKFLGFTVYNYEYLWVGFMVFAHKNIDWGTIQFDPLKNICDVGGMTWYFLKEKLKHGIKVKWLEHTADISHEFKEIFPEELWSSYSPEMGFQLIEDAVIHYYRGSNWDGNKENFLEQKNNFLKRFLEQYNGKSLGIKGTKYHHSIAYARKTYNGTPDNINEKVKPGFGSY